MMKYLPTLNVSYNAVGVSYVLCNKSTVEARNGEAVDVALGQSVFC